MCGRTACTLEPDDICRSCKQKLKDRSFVEPAWMDDPGGHKYYPSYNLSPSRFNPVLISKDQIIERGVVDRKSESECRWVVQPMQWGLVPHWHNGTPNSFGYKMNNARSDGMLTKTSFKKPLEMGRRCVVLADGYFEWKTSKDGKKQPYFLYFPQNIESSESKLEKCQQSEIIENSSDNISKIKEIKNFEIENKTSEEKIKQELIAGSNFKNDPIEFTLKSELKEEENKSECSKVKRLLTMAGLYDIWKSSDGNDLLYSYSIITVDAHPDIAWIHDRMPAILDGDDEVNNWLDYKSVPLDKAVQLIRPLNCLTSHPVSTMVNDARNKSPECIQLIDIMKTSEQQKKLSASGIFMNSWLKVGTKRSIDDEQDDRKAKFSKV